MWSGGTIGKLELGSAGVLLRPESGKPPAVAAKLEDASQELE